MGIHVGIQVGMRMGIEVEWVCRWKEVEEGDRVSVGNDSLTHSYDMRLPSGSQCSSPSSYNT